MQGARKPKVLAIYKLVVFQKMIYQHNLHAKFDEEKSQALKG